MAAEAPPRDPARGPRLGPGRATDPAEAVARVALAKRDVLLRAYRRRLRWEDLEDCYSQATLELVARARRGDVFHSPQHVANALEQKLASRINDRHRAVAGRSPGEAAMAGAVSVEDGQCGVSDLHDGGGEISDRVARRDEVARLREVAAELTDDQRLVLACQVGLDMQCGEFCRRFGWSAEKFRKVSQRARARLRVLVVEYQAGERCARLEPDLLAYVSRVAEGEQRRRITLHLENCPGCAHTARGLERASRHVAGLLPAPALLTGALAARGMPWAGALRRLVPWMGRDAPASPAPTGATGAAAAVATGGGGAVLGAGTTTVGAGALKLGVAALCVAGAAGGYAVCERAGIVPGPGRAHHAPAQVRRAGFHTAGVPAHPGSAPAALTGAHSSSWMRIRRLSLPRSTAAGTGGGRFPARPAHRTASPGQREFGRRAVAREFAPRGTAPATFARVHPGSTTDFALGRPRHGGGAPAPARSSASTPPALRLARRTAEFSGP